MSEALSINKYLPLAIVYFFFNSFLLPQGLLYTTLLTPLLLYWLARYQSFQYLLHFFYFSIPFAAIHLFNGVDTYFYLRAYMLMVTVYIFCICFYQFLQVCKTLRAIFKNLLFLNAILVVIALVAISVPSLKKEFWLSSDLSYGISGIDRLKMLVYEPSYYSLLLVPMALYYYLKSLMKALPNAWLMLLLITVPLLMSLSFGVILSLIFALFFTLLVSFKTFFSIQQKAYFIIGAMFLLALGVPFVLTFFPDNVFFQRFANVFSGKDTSFEGRTFDAFFLGYKVADMKSLLFGCGPGQVKLLGVELWQQFYGYRFNINTVAIPNAMAETLAVYGFVGVALRLTIEIYFFFRTKVYRNYYRLALFAFAFVYQFTGSFIYNIAEYVIWIMAFSSIFEEFDKKRIQS